MYHYDREVQACKNELAKLRDDLDAAKAEATAAINDAIWAKVARDTLEAEHRAPTPEQFPDDGMDILSDQGDADQADADDEEMSDLL